jgi:hypothetical protein
LRPLVAILAALLLATLQAALLRHVGGGAFSLCLPAAVLVHLALGAGNVEGAVGAAGVGLVLDLVLGTPKGLFTSLAVVVFLAARAVGTAVHVQGRIGYASLTAAAALGLSVGALGLTRLVTPPEAQPAWELLPRAVLEGALTGLVAPLIQVGLRRLDGLLGDEAPELVG